MTTDKTELSDLFQGFDPSLHEAEAEARWGETDAFAIARQRTRGYREDDWRALRDEAAAIYDALAAAQAAGRSPDDDQVIELAERHRLHLDRWFYPCSAEMHRGLADLYQADPRFAATIDRHGAGLTGFLCAAIRAAAGRVPR